MMICVIIVNSVVIVIPFYFVVNVPSRVWLAGDLVCVLVSLLVVWFGDSCLGGYVVMWCCGYVV